MSSGVGNGLRIYPQPANDILILEIENAITEEPVQLQIINNLGQIISEAEISFKNNQAKLNTTKLSSGAYYLNLNGVNKRFVITK